MMKQNIDKKDIYKEVFVVLSHFNQELIEKIPQQVFNKLIELAADSEHNVVIDVSKTIDKQDISEESKDIISLIYYNCIADEQEKKELVSLWDYNDRKQ